MATNLTQDVISSIKIQDKEYKLKSVPFHGTAAEWEVSDYIPKLGEIIIYDAETANESAKIKIGDGVSFARNLPFENEANKSVDIKDVTQIVDTYVVLDCGTSSINI